MSDAENALNKAIARIEDYSRRNPDDQLNATGAVILIKELISDLKV